MFTWFLRFISWGIIGVLAWELGNQLFDQDSLQAFVNFQVPQLLAASGFATLAVTPLFTRKGETLVSFETYAKGHPSFLFGLLGYILFLIGLSIVEMVWIVDFLLNRYYS